ncbi:ABC transporter substrate-binding protein [Cohnella sp.]|uniref:ABC transporter substrate-binding protein n=1 Tax=Cohnella sp. TaxID=1883426 RepID=UPI0035658882
MMRLIRLALVFVMALTLAACSGKEDSSNIPSAAKSNDELSGEKVTLDMWLFTGTGMEPFIEQYQKDHPNIKVNIQRQEYADHHNGLMTALAAGGGVPDVAVVEISYIDKFKSDPSKFNNLADMGAKDFIGNFLDWKLVQASSQDGQFIYGIPTDIGPMAIMFRTDLFQQAGLPTTTEEVSALLPSWEKYLEIGKTIKSKTGKPMTYAAEALFFVIRGQGKLQYFDDKGNLIADTNPDIKRAWDISVKAAQEGLTAEISAWTPEWGAGMNNGDFATVLAPAWMMGFMKANAPDSSGKWNIALMPEGSGNWGGSFLTIPKESKHPKEAYDLIKYLTSPETQLELFKKNGNFPSTPDIYSDPAIVNFKDTFYGDAEIGKIYAEAAKKVLPVYYGPDYDKVNAALIQALWNVEKNGVNPEETFRKGIETAKRDLGH